MSTLKPSSPSVPARMSSQASEDSAAELLVRRLLHAAGLRYRVEYPVPGMARDTESTEHLVVADWEVLRSWEHEAPDDVALRIAVALERRKIQRGRGRNR